MRIDAPQQTTAAKATGAIQYAARATGASFQYLLATAKVESNLNPDAAAKTSSAGGLFQFIEQTWFGTLKEAGGALGYGQYANAISRTDSGRYVVNDPAMKAEILKLRQDPTANALMAGVLTKSNAAILTQKLGRQPTDGELYIAHFLGAKGAASLIGQSEGQPGTRASSLFPNAARANRSIFFDRDGRARNVAEVSAALSGRFQTALAKQPAANVASVDPVAASAPIAAMRAAARTNPLSIPQAASVASIAPPPPVPGGIPISAASLRAAPVMAADESAPVAQAVQTANLRVSRTYEILSPNMVRSMAAPVSPNWVPTVTPPSPIATPVAATPPVAAPAMASAVKPRSQVLFEGEQVYSNPYRAAERREAVAPAVADMWTQAAANLARVRAAQGMATPAETQQHVQRVASAAPAPTAQPQRAAAQSGAASEPLGLFQDSRPNVRALFTGG